MLAGAAVDIEAQAGRLGGKADHLADLLARRGMQHPGGGARRELDEAGDLLASGEEIAAQGGDHPHEAAPRERLEDRDEMVPIAGRDSLGEELLELIDDDGEARARAWNEPTAAGRLLQGALDGPEKH